VQSLPLRGAWIETLWRGAGDGCSEVAPLAGGVD